MKKAASYNTEKKYYTFHAPLKFSIVNNPEEAVRFFNEIISFISDKRNSGKRLFIDNSKVSELTIDALMYLLAISNNIITSFNNRCTFSGNAPQDSNAKKLFEESGFYNFVKRQGGGSLAKSDDTVQIISGESCDTDLAKRLSDFVSSKVNVNTRCCSFLYSMMIELMSNTHRHAYSGNKSVLNPRWYCFAKYNQDKTISFSFMDTGLGIPHTVRKKFAEHLDLLGIKGEYSYVVSALNGESRTATGEEYRGKGLPKIREFSSAQKIKNLHILTNRANVVVHEKSYESYDIVSPLRGTLYFWQVDLTTLKGG